MLSYYYRQVVGHVGLRSLFVFSCRHRVVQVGIPNCTRFSSSTNEPFADSVWVENCINHSSVVIGLAIDHFDIYIYI